MQLMERTWQTGDALNESTPAAAGVLVPSALCANSSTQVQERTAYTPVT